MDVDPHEFLTVSAVPQIPEGLCSRYPVRINAGIEYGRSSIRGQESLRLSISGLTGGWADEFICSSFR